ncbi:proline iminopeptidase [Metamycoplasma subdolum]|uniref:Proline iminopeptidase n=1 Tax=Metamycoplasma subdolum TaxID=92407 RepID=A0A3L9ZYP2_9BACT|nr:prolyl aminopeptidase [Metamycoplasma subdolum]RMA77570.1 proline iminopeptidase [Metamycoplasma subdolum]WPB50364.1 prolyl aminopeptidase [Metamycoplasma subdolum]
MEKYPLTEPFKKGFLNVSKIHTIYYEEVGNKDGEAVLYIHGGPGGSIKPEDRQYFDPKFYHAVLFDQRGCGKSTPSAEIKENTTLDLVEDIEKLRKYLGIEKWVVFGGSWGSTLSLIYAISHPERVKALVLRGVYLGTKEENEWLYNQAKTFFPDKYEDLVSILDQKDTDLIKAYYPLLNNKNKKIAQNAAYHWAKWELSLVALKQIPNLEEVLSNSKFNLEIARLENHYFHNDIFLEDNFILKNINKIKDIKTYIIQGRYDMVCPPISAYKISKKLNNCNLHFAPTSGHSSYEIEISEGLVDALEDLKKHLK